MLKLQFPKESDFQYIIKMLDGNGSVVTETPVTECYYVMQLKCSDPVGLQLLATQKQSLLVRWSPPTDMGSLGSQLCYEIQYDSSDGKVKFPPAIIYSDLDQYQFTIRSLLPYTSYTIKLRCAVSCKYYWSNFVGPVTATTLEEAPQGAVIFEDRREKIIDEKSRDVTVFYRLPPKEKWNGAITEIRLYCYREQRLCNTTVLQNVEFSDFTRNISYSLLRRDKQYRLQAEYCNNEGCSPPSNNLTIAADQIQATKAALRERIENSVPFWLIGVICAIIVSVVLVIGMYWFCRRSQNRPSIEQEIGEVQPSDSDLNATETENNEYCTTFAPATSATLNADSTDFQSASVRSLHSDNLIGCMTDQSTVVDDGYNINNASATDFQNPQGDASTVHEDNSLLLTSIS